MSNESENDHPYLESPVELSSAWYEALDAGNENEEDYSPGSAGQNSDHSEDEE
jgi:hypothetical protein